jgi:hypothetical protein
MQSCQLIVTRHRKGWAISADGDVLAVARLKRDATRLAREAAATLCRSGFHAEVVAPPRERRSFTGD